jgi:glucosamine kinase
MILIADSGGSKTDWSVLDQGNLIASISTAGLNPYFVDQAIVAQAITEELLPAIPDPENISQVFFYGAGCSGDDQKEIIRMGLKKHFSHSDIEVFSDMIGAARALCGRDAGIVAILGTGSNSCVFENDTITARAHSLGYVLGDEGGGSDLGKRLLRAYFYSEISTELRKKFEARYGSSEEKILEQIYKKPYPNRYLASFVPFIAENLSAETTDLVRASFASFISQHILKYPDAKRTLPVSATGSVAHVFSDIFTEELKKNNLKAGKILKSPMQGLIDYHRE